MNHALFYEQRALFTNVLASLLVCRDVINKEKATKANRKRCAELLLKQCDEIIADMKNSIQYTQAPVTCEIQQLIDELGWEEAAQQGFHRFNLKEITEYALMRDANSRQAQVLSLDISKCQQKAADMRILFKYFDEFRPEPTRQKPSALKVLLIVNWMGGTCEWPIKQCYDLLAQNYKNALPTWHTVSTRKNQIPDLRDQQEKHDKELNAFLLQHAKGMAVTFHRAFDHCQDTEEALEDLIELGFDRVLTSGQQPTALEGADLLRWLHTLAAGRIRILAGCGVNEQNIAQIAQTTGVREFHFSAREPFSSRMQYTNPAVYMGAKEADESAVLLTTERRVRDTIRALTASF